jgi:hypothetical protein
MSVEKLIKKIRPLKWSEIKKIEAEGHNIFLFMENGTPPEAGMVLKTMEAIIKTQFEDKAIADLYPAEMISLATGILNATAKMGKEEESKN